MVPTHSKSGISTVDNKRNVMKQLERERSRLSRSKLNDLNRNQCFDLISESEELSNASEYETDSNDSYSTESTSTSSSSESLDATRLKSFKMHTKQNASEKRAEKKRAKVTKHPKNRVFHHHQKTETNILNDENSNGDFFNEVSTAIRSMNDNLSNLSKSFVSLEHDLMSCQPYLDMSTKMRFTLQSLPSFPIGSDSTDFYSEDNVVHLPIKMVDEVKKNRFKLQF